MKLTGWQAARYFIVFLFTEQQDLWKPESAYYIIVQSNNKSTCDAIKAILKS